MRMKKYSRGNKKKTVYASKEAVLPSNYSELFFDTIKQNWRSIIATGLMALLFLLPLLAFSFGKDLYFLRLASSSYTQEEIDALRITSRNYFNIGVAFGIAFFSIGVSGLSRLNLFIAREEGFFFFPDFNKGIKQNIKSNFVFFFVYALLIYLSLLVINNINARFVAYIPLAIVQTLFFPLLLINIETTSIYDWKIKDAFRNSALIYIKNFLFIFLFSLFYNAVLLLQLIPYIFLKYLIIVLLVILVYPFINVGMRVYFNKILDRDINKDNYPEIYKMGIYENENLLDNSVNNYYGPTSTIKSIKHDPYLNTYYSHLCEWITHYPENEDSLIVQQNDVWPTDDTINSLNYLRQLVLHRQTTFLSKKNYSALGLLQKEKAKVAIVIAGGGYGCVCTLPEGLPVCVDLHKKGFTVFSFVYPVKEESKLANECLKSFIKLLFKNEIRMNIDMDDYIVVGFSAGAHLAGSVATDNFGMFTEGYPNPGLIGLAYPVISMGTYSEKGTKINLLGNDPTEEEIKAYSLELHVDSHYSNVFIWSCDKDNVVPFENTLLMVEALKKNNIDYRLEAFDDDKHGWSLGNGTKAEGWLDRLVEFYYDIISKK